MLMAALWVFFLMLQATDSDYEDELPKHSFVNHYMSDPTYYNSWKRQQKGVKHPASYRYEECAASETEPYFQTVITTQSSGGVYTPTGQPAPGSRTPVTGFSSFVWDGNGGWSWTASGTWGDPAQWLCVRWTMGNFSIRVEMDGNTDEAGVRVFFLKTINLKTRSWTFV